MSRSLAAIAIGAIVALAIVAVAGMILLRSTSTTTGPGGVAVECVGVSATGCEAWAASVLADGPATHTIDPDDLERVRLSHAVLGVVGDCQAEYFIGRYDEAAARETVACP